MTAPFDWSIEAELFVRLSESVGDITFTSKSDVIFSYNPFFDPNTRVAKLNADRQSASPFPNAEWNTPRKDTDLFLDSVLGLRCDGNGVV